MAKDSLLGTDSNRPVVGTYSLVDNAIGVHGGGPLFADHTFGGRVTVNLDFLGFSSGDVIAQLVPIKWDYANDPTGRDPRPGILFTYDVQPIKGSLPQFIPDPFRDWAPITGTGTPNKIDNPVTPNPDLIVRVNLF